MKPIFIFLLLPFFGFSQSDKNTSVVTIVRDTVLYRGLANPIKINVPEAKSFTAKSPGLTKIDDKGNYEIDASGLNEVTIEIDIIFKNGKKKHETKTLRVKPMPTIRYIINGKPCNECPFTREQLAKAEISVEAADCNYFEPAIITGFKLKIPGEKTIDVKGPKFDSRTIKKIMNAKRGDIIIISEVNGTIKDLPVYPRQFALLAIKII